jgi:hypothetical protein
MKIIRHGAHALLAIIEHRGEKASLSRMRALQQEWVPLFLKGMALLFSPLLITALQSLVASDNGAIGCASADIV